VGKNESSVKRTKKSHLSSTNFLETGNFNSFQSFNGASSKKKNKKNECQRKFANNSVRDKLRVVTNKEVSHKKQNTATNSSIFKFLTSPRSTKHNNKIMSSRMEVKII